MKRILKVLVMTAEILDGIQFLGAIGFLCYITYPNLDFLLNTPEFEHLILSIKLIIK